MRPESISYCVPCFYDDWWWDAKQVLKDLEIVLVQETYLLTLHSGRTIEFTDADWITNHWYSNPKESFLCISVRHCIDFSRCSSDRTIDIPGVGLVQRRSIESAKLVAVENKTVRFKYHEGRKGLFNLFRHEWLTFEGETEWKKVFG